jgi:Ser/Thr protein kinase RdoA (MazF antagonist)
MAFVGFGWESGSPVVDRWDALLSGYESVRKLTESERAALPALHRYATLSIAAWRYWKHVMVEPHELLGKRYFEMVDRLETELVFLGESD